LRKCQGDIIFMTNRSQLFRDVCKKTGQSLSTDR
jgi:hypothetical protein